MLATQNCPLAVSYPAFPLAYDDPDRGTAQPLDWQDLVVHRDYLVRFAKRKLQVSALAEDLVHDVFEAVITKKANFSGRAALRSWLTAVLKNKIVDTIRQRARYDDLDAQDGSDGEWEIACDLAGPEENVQYRQALSQTLQRIEQLPSALRDAMRFRILEEESSQDVCHRLQITESSLFVRLHRARKQLLC